MYMVPHPVERKNFSFKVAGLAAYQLVDEGFKLRRKERFTVLGRPDDVIEKLPVGHQGISYAINRRVRKAPFMGRVV